MALSHEACAYRVGRRTFAVAAAIVSIAWGIWAPLAASADDSTNCAPGVAGLCIADNISMGDAVSDPTNDTGVATYVGRDMYIGAANGSGKKPRQSYAAEAEGLTVINGKLAIHQVKDSWPTNNGSNGWYPAGFRFGAVGYGSQFRPQSSGAILAVGGSASSNIGTINSNGNTSVGAWTHGAWVNKSKDNYGKTLVSIGTDSSRNDINYTAQIAGASTKITSTDTNYTDTNYSNRESVVDNAGNWTGPTGSGSFWNSASPLTVRGTDYSGGASEAKVVNGRTIVALSSKLSGLSTTGSVSSSLDSTGSYTRYKYTYNTSTTGYDQYKYVVNDASGTKISFTGDRKSSLQVFSLDSSSLPTSGNVSFAFTDIPDDASVVINVTGKTISLHNGWRFYWSGTDISNYFVTAGKATPNSGTTTEDNTLYASVASRILWNFTKASSVTIEGSQGEGKIYGGQSSSTTTQSGCRNGCSASVSDEPSSAFMGSVLVPNGSLESHVSTNGRVWVGQDFSMYNPTAITLGNGGDTFKAPNGATASVVDMDQERHNLPWRAVYSTAGSGITWQKVDSDGKALGGTTWGIYASKDNAKAMTSPLKTVTDNDAFDEDSAEGTMTVSGLNPNATYYIREISVGSNSTYALNKNIYSVHSGNTGSIGYGLTWVADAGGSSSTDHQLVDRSGNPVDSSGVKITNAETSVSWSKVDAASTGTLLKGSEWMVSTGSVDSGRSWTVADNDGSASYSCTASDPTDGTRGVLCDTDTTAGKFTVKGLSSGTTYTLKETKAPDGYVKSDTEYSFTIDADGSASPISSTTQTVTDDKITNAKTAVSWSKVDAADTGSLLSGSAWTVSTGSGDSARSWTVKDNDGSSSYTCTASDPTSSTDTTGVLCDTDKTAGKFTVEGLSYGSTSGTSYSLTEKTAPDGYVKSDTEYSFTIDADGSASPISSTTQTVKDDKITNAKAITALPKTGAWWIGRTMEIIGVALVALAGLGYGATTLIRRRDGGQGSARP